MIAHLTARLNKKAALSHRLQLRSIRTRSVPQRRFQLSQLIELALRGVFLSFA
jgi:hypothetical protein